MVAFFHRKGKHVGRYWVDRVPQGGKRSETSRTRCQRCGAPTGVTSNRLLSWLSGIDALRRSLLAA